MRRYCSVLMTITLAMLASLWTPAPTSAQPTGPYLISLDPVAAEQFLNLSVGGNLTFSATATNLHTTDDTDAYFTMTIGGVQHISGLIMLPANGGAGSVTLVVPISESVVTSCVGGSMSGSFAGYVNSQIISASDYTFNCSSANVPLILVAIPSASLLIENCGPINDELPWNSTPTGLQILSDTDWQENSRTITYGALAGYEISGSNQLVLKDSNTPCWAYPILPEQIQACGPNNDKFELEDGGDGIASWEISAWSNGSATITYRPLGGFQIKPGEESVTFKDVAIACPTETAVPTKVPVTETPIPTKVVKPDVQPTPTATAFTCPKGMEPVTNVGAGQNEIKCVPIPTPLPTCPAGKVVGPVTSDTQTSGDCQPAPLPDPTCPEGMVLVRVISGATEPGGCQPAPTPDPSCPAGMEPAPAGSGKESWCQWIPVVIEPGSTSKDSPQSVPTGGKISIASSGDLTGNEVKVFALGASQSTTAPYETLAVEDGNIIDVSGLPLGSYRLAIEANDGSEIEVYIQIVDPGSVTGLPSTGSGGIEKQQLSLIAAAFALAAITGGLFSSRTDFVSRSNRQMEPR